MDRCNDGISNGGDRLTSPNSYRLPMNCNALEVCLELQNRDLLPNIPTVIDLHTFAITTNTGPSSVDATPLGWLLVDQEVSLFEGHIRAENGPYIDRKAVNPRKFVRCDFSDLVIETDTRTPSAPAVCARETGNEACMAISLHILHSSLY